MNRPGRAAFLRPPGGIPRTTAVPPSQMRPGPGARPRPTDSCGTIGDDEHLPRPLPPARTGRRQSHRRRPHRFAPRHRPAHRRHPRAPLASDGAPRADRRHRHRRHQGDGGRRGRRRQHPGAVAHGDPGQVQEPQGGRGHDRRAGARPVRPARRARGGHRRGRLGGRRPQPRPVRPPPVLAQRAAAGPPRGAPGRARPGRQRRQLRRLGRVALRRRTRRGPPRHDHSWYRHRRRHPGGRPGQARQVRGRGEFGHMQVVPGGHRCPCGNRGCWEQYSSGNALVREARSWPPRTPRWRTGSSSTSRGRSATSPAR